MVHSVYRNSFWAVDRFNKLSLGPNSIQFSVMTQSWTTRVFLAMLACSETNAYLIHNTMLKRDGRDPLSHNKFKEDLAQALINNPYREMPAVAGPSTCATQPSEVNNHVLLTRAPKKKNLVCVICQQYGGRSRYPYGSLKNKPEISKYARTRRTVFTCQCGVHVCPPTLRTCHFIHQLNAISAPEWH